MEAVAVRAPLRVALGGGGTDLPSYYREYGGLVVSTAIPVIRVDLGATLEHVLLLASSGASCPSCRTPLTEEPTATPVRRRRIALPRERAVSGADRPSPQPT